MRKNIIVLILFFIFITCQKKATEESTLSTTSTGNPIVYEPKISVNVNDTVYSCISLSCISAYKSGNTRGISMGDQSAKRNLFQLTFSKTLQLGTYPLVKDAEVAFTYVRENIYYKITSGSINITEVDTSDRGVINKFVATFYAKTDTTLSAQYPIFKLTEGKINIRP